MSPSFLSLPLKILLKIFEHLFADAKQPYNTALLIHPTITDLCNTYNDKIFLLYRARILHRLLTPPAFVYLAVHVLIQESYHCRLPRSIYDFDWETLRKIERAALRLSPIYTWVLRNSTWDKEEETHAALFRAQGCKKPEIFMAVLCSTVHRNSKSEMSGWNTVARRRWMRELGKVRVHKPVHGNVLRSIADSLTQMGNAAMDACGMTTACCPSERFSKFKFTGSNPLEYYFGWKEHEKMIANRFPRVGRFSTLFIAYMDVRDVIRYYDFDGLKDYIEISEEFAVNMAAGRYKKVENGMQFVGI